MNNVLMRATLMALTVGFVLWAGCAGMLDLQHAKDRDLGNAVDINLRTDARFNENFVSFKMLEAGKYECVTRRFTDPQEIGVFAYNVMVVLAERNDTKVHTGRNRFTIVGVQGGDIIFEVVYGSGMQRPGVTFKGPFEGEEYTPSF